MEDKCKPSDYLLHEPDNQLTRLQELYQSLLTEDCRKQLIRFSWLVDFATASVSKPMEVGACQLTEMVVILEMTSKVLAGTVLRSSFGTREW